jgi:hypothetical protein
MRATFAVTFSSNLKKILFHEMGEVLEDNSVIFNELLRDKQISPSKNN